MRAYDLSTGTARLEMATDAIQMARSLISESWNDSARRRFNENHLDPLDPKLVRALHAIRQLQEVLADAERSCGPL